MTSLHSVGSSSSDISDSNVPSATPAPAPPSAPPSAPVVVADPDIFVYSVHSDSEFAILASDGLWDKVSNQEAVRLVRGWLAGGATAEEAARKLVEFALKLDTPDNVSVAVLRFSSRPLVCQVPRFGHSALRRPRSEAAPSAPAATTITTNTTITTATATACQCGQASLAQGPAATEGAVVTASAVVGSVPRKAGAYVPPALRRQLAAAEAAGMAGAAPAPAAPTAL